MSLFNLTDTLFQPYVTQAMVSAQSDEVLYKNFFLQLVADVGHSTITLMSGQGGLLDPSVSSQITSEGMSSQLEFLNMPQPSIFTHHHVHNYLTISQSHLGTVSSEIFARGLLAAFY